MPVCSYGSPGFGTLLHARAPTDVADGLGIADGTFQKKEKKKEVVWSNGVAHFSMQQTGLGYMPAFTAY